MCLAYLQIVKSFAAILCLQQKAFEDYLPKQGRQKSAVGKRKDDQAHGSSMKAAVFIWKPASGRYGMLVCLELGTARTKNRIERGQAHPLYASVIVFQFSKAFHLWKEKGREGVRVGIWCILTT